MTRNRLRAIAITMLTGALGIPVMGAAQETKCTSREAEDRERAVRRYQQEIERVQREIAGYAGLSHSAATSMKVIGESLGQWKPGQLRTEIN